MVVIGAPVVVVVIVVDVSVVVVVDVVVVLFVVVVVVVVVVVDSSEHVPDSSPIAAMLNLFSVMTLLLLAELLPIKTLSP